MSTRYLLDRLFVGGTFTLMSGAFISRLVDLTSIDIASTGSARMQMIWLCIYLITLARIWERRALILEILLRNKALLLFTLMSILSTAWSAVPSSSLRHGFAFIFTALVGVDYATRYSLEEQVRLALKIVWLIISVSVFVQLFVPGFITRASLGADFLVDQDAWIGLFSQKNLFGYLLALGGILTVLHFRTRLRVALKVLIGLLFIFTFLEKANSQTAIVVILVVSFSLVSMSALKWTRRSRMTLGIAFAILVAGTATLLTLSRAALAGLLGRKADFTGRTEIWELVWQSIGQRPLLGFGFNSFWLTTYESYNINRIVSWTVPSAHNQYLDVILQMGFLGIAVLAVAFGVAMWRAVLLLRDRSETAARWPFAYLVMTLVYGITESGIIAGNSLYWVFFVAACIAATRYAPSTQRESFAETHLSVS